MVLHPLLLGVDDARSMQRYFEPKFLEYDLVHMNNRHFVISMTIEGEKVPAFSAISLSLPPIVGDQTDAIIARSRAEYGSSRTVVENFVGERYLNAGPNTSRSNASSNALAAEKSQMQPTTKNIADLKPLPLTPAPEPAEPAELAKVVQPVTVARTALRGAVQALVGKGRTKRKRARRRKRKPSSEQPSV